MLLSASLHAAYLLGVQYRTPCVEVAGRLGAITPEDVGSLVPFNIIVAAPHIEQLASGDIRVRVAMHKQL